MLSSGDIRETKFSKAMGGYKQEEVDILLDKVEADYSAYERLVQELRGTVESLRKEIDEYKSSQSSIQSVLLSAKKLADQIVAEAKQKSEAIVLEARGSVERISREEKELSAAFEEKASSRKAQIEKELEAVIADADKRKTAIEAACADAVRRQQLLFDKLRLEIVAFKTDIRQRYKEHLALLQSLPDEVPMDPKQIAEAVSAAVDKVPNPETFVAENEHIELKAADKTTEEKDDGFHIAASDISNSENEEENI